MKVKTHHMTELPKEIIDRYKIRVIDSVESPGNIIYNISIDGHYIGIFSPQIREKTYTWDLISPGGSVVSFYKNVDTIHVSCL
jgi:hypothetical protein